MTQLRTDDLIVIDIETASEYSAYHKMPDYWQQLWDEKTARVRPEGINAAEFYPQRAGVMAEFSKVVCISMGYFIKEQNLKIRVKSFYGFDEKKILTDFLATVTRIESLNKNWCFAGHNIKEFDIPFICRRLVVNGIRIPAYLDFQNMKPWETNIVDTFQYWRFGDFKNYTSLKLLAATLGIPSPKDDIDGSMVGELFWNSDDDQRQINLKRIAVYCQKDVVTTANIILKFKNILPVHNDDVEIVEN